VQQFFNSAWFGVFKYHMMPQSVEGFASTWDWNHVEEKGLMISSYDNWNFNTMRKSWANNYTTISFI